MNSPKRILWRAFSPIKFLTLGFALAYYFIFLKNRRGVRETPRPRPKFSAEDAGSRNFKIQISNYKSITFMDSRLRGNDTLVVLSCRTWSGIQKIVLNSRLRGNDFSVFNDFMFLRQLLIQISPARVLFFNQCYLPYPTPFLELFLAGDSGDRIRCLFVVHQRMDCISFCKTFHRISFMFIHPSGQIICYTNIQRSVLFTCKYIYVVISSHQFWIPAYAGMTSTLLLEL